MRKTEKKINKMLQMTVYCCLMKHDNEVYLMCERNGHIIGFKAKKKAIDYWEDGYENAFKRGICGATGATLTALNLSPSIVYFETQKKMIDCLFNAPPFQSYELAMGIFGVKVQKDVFCYWEDGYKPELIKYV